jgi:transposase-like protein
VFEVLVEIMPPKISRDVKLDAVEMRAKGKTTAEIKDALGCSSSTIHRAKQNLRKHGDVEPKQKKSGPKSKLTPEMENVYCFFFLCLNLH